jgi:hypothetical protein
LQRQADAVAQLECFEEMNNDSSAYKTLLDSTTIIIVDNGIIRLFTVKREQTAY